MQADVFWDQVVIFTGASSGIGKALALQLAGQEAKVILSARHGVGVPVICPLWVVPQFHETQLGKDDALRGARSGKMEA